MKSKFTVVLRRPSPLWEDESVPEFYTAIGAEGTTVEEALFNAQKEALKADKKSWGNAWQLTDVSASDYHHIIVFRGEHQPVLFDFQRI